MSEKSKYENKNPVHQFFLGRFLKAAAKTAVHACGEGGSIADIGSADGYFYETLKRHYPAFRFSYHAYDIDSAALEHARHKFPNVSFKEASIYDIMGSATLVCCMEVLEHLQEPSQAIENLAKFDAPHFLFSVPHEPWFMLGNLSRGRHIRRFGNHPEHLNHWSKHSFRLFLLPYFTVVEDHSSFPWILYLCKKRSVSTPPPNERPVHR